MNVGMPRATVFYFVFRRYHVAELDGAGAVEAAVGLLVVLCEAVGVGGHGVAVAGGD